MTGVTFTELVGCRYPVQLAAMAAVGGPELAAAVRDAGGLGMVASADQVPAGCGVNFLVPFLTSTTAVAEAATRSRVVEFFFGAPDREMVSAARDGGAVVGWQVGSVGEARHAAHARCDYVIAQGTEAGGHVRGRISLDALLGEVLASVQLPVVAAGGIATPERVAELIARGAAAVRVGTRFVACPESNAHEQYIDNLLAATGADTVLTGWFDDDWPDAPHRVLRSALDAAQRSGWRSSQPPHKGIDRSVADMAQYAGAGVGAVTRRQAADSVLQDLVSLLPR